MKRNNFAGLPSLIEAHVNPYVPCQVGGSRVPVAAW